MTPSPVPQCYIQDYGRMEKCPTCEWRVQCARKQEEEREKQRRVCEGSCLMDGETIEGSSGL